MKIVKVMLALPILAVVLALAGVGHGASAGGMNWNSCNSCLGNHSSSFNFLSDHEVNFSKTVDFNFNHNFSQENFVAITNPSPCNCGPSTFVSDNKVTNNTSVNFHENVNFSQRDIVAINSQNNY